MHEPVRWWALQAAPRLFSTSLHSRARAACALSLSALLSLSRLGDGGSPKVGVATLLYVSCMYDDGNAAGRQRGRADREAANKKMREEKSRRLVTGRPIWSQNVENGDRTSEQSD